MNTSSLDIAGDRSPSARRPPPGVLRFARQALPAALILLVAACAHNPALDEGRDLIAAGRLEEGVLRLGDATRERPDDREARATYLRQRDLAVGQWLAAADTARLAGRLPEAEELYRRSLRLDAANTRAAAGLKEIDTARRHDGLVQDADARLRKGEKGAADTLARTVLAENPGHAGAKAVLRRLEALGAQQTPPAAELRSPFAKPITLEFRDAPLRSVFEAISRSAGVNFVFDKDVKGDARVTLFVRNTSIDEVVRLILATHQLERKLLNESSLLIYPNTAAKAKEFQELAVKTFYLANAEAKQAQILLKTVVKSRDIFIDEKLNLVIVKDTPEALRLAESVIAALDLPEPEVMLEVEVLEISRSRLFELGLRFPDAIGYGQLQSQATTTTIVNGVTQSVTTPGGALAGGYVDLHNRSGLTSFVANPALTLNLKSQSGNSDLLANPRIRVRNREKAKVHIGEKLPVFTTTSTANVGVSANVSYLDVGLKLDVEPTVTLEDEVAMRVSLEVSSIVKEVPGPSGSLAYQVGTRSAATVLRLRNGETQVLAGLISDEERSAANRLPGLGDLPLIGRLFSSTKDSGSKTEIVLLITPRILRNLVKPEAVQPYVPSGTEVSVGAPPLRIQSTSPGGLGLSSTGAMPAGDPPGREAETPVESAPAAAPEESANPSANPGAAAGAERR